MATKPGSGENPAKLAKKPWLADLSAWWEGRYPDVRRLFTSALPGDDYQPPVIDTSIAHPARVYDYYLGGYFR